MWHVAPDSRHVGYTCRGRCDFVSPGEQLEGTEDSSEAATSATSWETLLVSEIRTSSQVVTQKTAIHDPPESYEANPIHSAEGAASAGYSGALVAGIHTYGWSSAAILSLLGDRWLDDGWADVRYRRPVYPDDVLTTTVTMAGDADHATVSTAKDDGSVVLDGTAGLGKATWFAELTLPDRRTAEPEVADAEKVRMTLESAPVGEDYRPMAVDASLKFHTAWVTTRLEEDDARYIDADGPPRLHPAFIAGRMTPLFRHSYLYGPAIHARSQIQHLAPAHAGQTLTVAARLFNAYERKGHHYHESDCVILGADGTELVAKRHTGIFKVAGA